MVGSLWVAGLLALGFSSCAISPDRGQESGPTTEQDASAGPQVDRGAALEAAATLALGEAQQDRYADLADQIQQIVPKDAIPAIDEPRFWSVEEANRVYRDEDLVLGLDLEGRQRAYSIPFLSDHEIVNDELAGRPITVTW